MEWLFGCHNDGRPDVDLIEQADHIFVEHANAAKADSSSEIHPVGPGCSVNGVFTSPKLEVAMYRTPTGFLGPGAMTFPFL